MNELDFSASYSVESMPGIAFHLLRYVETQSECQGHPDDGEMNGPIGETFYCDGSCEETETDESQVVAMMIGDDREHIIDVYELRKLDNADYCYECGQIGCGHATLESED